MLTCRADRDDRSRAIDLGVDAFLAKPFAVHELMSRVGLLLQKQRLPEAAGAR